MISTTSATRRGEPYATSDEQETINGDTRKVKAAVRLTINTKRKMHQFPRDDASVFAICAR